MAKKRAASREGLECIARKNQHSDQDRPTSSETLSSAAFSPDSSRQTRSTGPVIMETLKKIVRAGLRWGWFGLLVMLAFGYLASGLSSPRSAGESVVSSGAGSDRGAALPKADVDEVFSVVSRIDERWSDALGEAGLTATETADWLTVCRRISLSLVGSGLSLEEIRQLEQLPEAERESAHLAALLEDSRFHHYWAERWSRFLVGTDGGEFLVYRRRRFRIWLAEQFAENRRYDEMTRELIGGEGLWTDQPQVNFLTATVDSNEGQPDPIRLAARTARTFLGLRIDCLQCHDDFLGNVSLGDPDQLRGGAQTDFHQLAAFYSSARMSGLQGVQSGEVDYRYQYLYDSKETEVEPSVPFLKHLLPEDGDPRERLAAWITHPENKQAARAAVSHVWALVYGAAVGDAVDNLPLDEEVDPVIDLLATDFVEHGFDLRRLISAICRSARFRLRSDADFEVQPQHERVGAVFPLVRLRPEQVAGAVIQAARIKKIDRDSSVFIQLQQFIGSNDFVQKYGDVGEDEFKTESVTITQRLLMMNGELLSEMVDANPVMNSSSHIDMFARESGQAVETLFLAALNRYPTSEEKSYFTARLEQADQRGEAIQDLLWVLLNSSELAWNH